MINGFENIIYFDKTEPLSSVLSWRLNSVKLTDMVWEAVREGGAVEDGLPGGDGGEGAVVERGQRLAALSPRPGTGPTLGVR